ncbi:MAG: FtsX-like permease family protein [Clostridiales bacterium]|jgi:ABC-type lipoprotein release transport system permease subunit|nr:FtsX-like permease family protein [Clostridiales bacterium]
MKILFKLALRNLLGAGLRTWLNIAVLSFAFVAIIWTQGFYRGMSRQAIQALTDAEYGGGQYWHEQYDPFNPLTLDDAHGRVPEPLQKLIEERKATAVLIIQGTLYPHGRFLPVTVRGIDPAQGVLLFPSEFLETGDGNDAEIPAIIGSRMARSTGLKVGDTVTLRWRDARGAFDARNIRIVQVMSTTVQSIDQGQIWLSLDTLRSLAGMEGEATLITLAKGTPFLEEIPGWSYKSPDVLLKDIHDLVRSKTLGATILYIILILLAMLAIFDTQVLSIFRRRKEMGTLMAMGMTRLKIIQLFTIEGALHSVLAALVAAVYGIPLLTLSARSGWAMPQAVDSYGYAIGERIFPVYSAGLVIGTTVLVMLVTTVVSFLPTRKISRLKPTDALRGRMP